ncbi:hypothetical protein [Vibrio agarivorans]|uniref:hypothetical protein n=1 Tax=Vibrio agarivorans TaxID=153622 RepID=UPI00222FE458|nr:hypothetical protein [Vibrio agarivorans]
MTTMNNLLTSLRTSLEDAYNYTNEVDTYSVVCEWADRETIQNHDCRSIIDDTELYRLIDFSDEQEAMQGAESINEAITAVAYRIVRELGFNKADSILTDIKGGNE